MESESPKGTTTARLTGLRGFRSEKLAPCLACAVVLACSVLACSPSAKPDFGTLPVVKVPLGRSAPPDPVPAKQESGDFTQVSRDPPDPAPLNTRQKYVYTVRYFKGELSIVSIKPITLNQPLPTERRVGRFAFELWTSDEIVERLRFDFPLLGASTASEKDALEAGLDAQQTISIPVSSRATRARILDRKTRKMLAVSWPPPAPSRVSDPVLSSDAVSPREAVPPRDPVSPSDAAPPSAETEDEGVLSPLEVQGTP